MARLPWYLKVTHTEARDGTWVMTVRVSRLGIPVLLLRSLRRYKVPLWLWPRIILRYYLER